MIRAAILDAARQYVTRDRAATHGDAENNFSCIAGHWTWWLQGKLAPGQAITAHDVAQMMVGFKQARAKGNPAHLDNFTDGCGYFALAGEIAAQPTRERDLRAAQLRGHGGCDDAPVNAGSRQDTAAEALGGGLHAQVGASGHPRPRDGEGTSTTVTESEG